VDDGPTLAEKTMSVASWSVDRRNKVCRSWQHPVDEAGTGIIKLATRAQRSLLPLLLIGPRFTGEGCESESPMVLACSSRRCRRFGASIIPVVA